MLGSRLNIKSAVVVGVFFIFTPVVLGTSLFSLSVLAENEDAQAKNNSTYQGAKIFASLPSQKKSISPVLGISDARPEILTRYLQRYDSPLVPFVNQMIDIADKHGLDFRLTTAIAQQESNLCKKIPPGSHNCWGWGIHSRGTLGFATYMDALETVSVGIRAEYLDKGLFTPEQIMTKYTPLSNGSWAEGVTKFMEEME